MPAVGDLLADRYRIDGVLGAGGMASVYLAMDLRLERQVAAKVLLPNLARDPSLAERFDREARILASVAHPNVAEVFDVERGDPDAGREPFYVMELCEGGSLAGRIESAGPMEPGALVPIVVSVAAALGELHRRGLIHRDVKPANILFAGGRPKLADFGLTKSGGSPGLDTLTAPGTAIGTPAYMAPELVTGGVASTASDVYALAATTFHALTGRAPRQADSLTSLATADGAPMPRVSELSPRLARSFDEIVGAGLAEDPTARPTLNVFTAGLVSALDRVTSAEPVAEPVTDPVAAAEPLDETTIVAAPLPTRVPRPTGRAPIQRAASGPAPRSSLPLGAAALAIAFVVVSILALSGLSSLWQAVGQAASGPASLRPGATAAGSPSPTPSSSPFASPSPTPDPASPALQALRSVQAAIDAARGGKDGLKGGEANDLTNMALQVGQRLRDGDDGGARQSAVALQQRVQKLHLDTQRSDALLSAIQKLIDAIPD